MRILSLLFIIFVLSGCASTYTQSNLDVPNAKLLKGKSAVIATPVNGFYGTTQYPESGRMTAFAVRAVFAKFTNNVSVLTECRDLECLLKADAATNTYYVVPEILHWEDRATEWSGIPDRIEIKLSIYDGKTSTAIASSVISGKSKWATFGGDHPQDLLPEPLNKYIESLY